MGYDTEFRGSFQIEPPLSRDQVAYLKKFSETRRMKRSESLASLRPDPCRKAIDLPIGQEGCYFTGGIGFHGKDLDVSIIDNSCPPIGQPGLWCQWIPNDEGTELEWDEGEKFYEYIAWLKYLIDHFFAPWGKVLNGVVKWRGEDFDDAGSIVVHNNVVCVY
jgi:hypothetical protein